jgi:peptidoglycan endopeptidase LytF
MHFEDLAAYNGIVNPHRIRVGQVVRIPGGQVTTTPSGGETRYTVQTGDNLFRIALRYNMSYLYLASYNGISNPHMIQVGQVIRIPTLP